MTAFHKTSTGVGIADTVSTVDAASDQGVYRARYDSSRDSTSLAVVAAVATAVDSDPMELPPLESSIDTDGLDRLFRRSRTNEDGLTRTTFCYAGFKVTVFGDGFIVVDEFEVPNTTGNGHGSVEGTTNGDPGK